MECKSVGISNNEERINDMMASLKNKNLDDTEFDDALVRKIIQSISVEAKDALKITFKDGKEITQQWR